MADEQDPVLETMEAPQPGAQLTGARPWWQVRPVELAARYDFDADELMDDIYPEGLPDWQLDLAIEALAQCHGEESQP